MVCDSRIRTRWEALDRDACLYPFNRLLDVQNFVTGRISRMRSAFAPTRKCLETVPWEKDSDDFVFDQQFLIQAAMLKQRLGDVPVAARYFAEASSINFRRSCVYGLSALYYLALSVIQRLGLASFDLFTPKPPR